MKSEEAEKNFKIVDEQLKFKANHELEWLKGRHAFIQKKIAEERRLRIQVYTARSNSYASAVDVGRNVTTSEFLYNAA